MELCAAINKVIRDKAPEPAASFWLPLSMRAGYAPGMRFWLVTIAVCALAGCATVPEGRLEERFGPVHTVSGEAKARLRGTLLPAFDVRGKSVVAALRELVHECEPLGVYFDIAEQALPSETPVSTIFDRTTSNKVDFSGFRVPVMDALSAICGAGSINYSVEGNTVYIPPGGPALRAATLKCFEDLYALGLPDVSQGAYIELDAFRGSSDSWPLTNSAAWWLGPDGADAAWFLVDQCEAVRVRGHRSHARSLGRFLAEGDRLRRGKKKRGEFAGVWRGLDLGASVRSIPSFCRTSRFGAIEVRSLVFLFAANVARYGREEEAWQIARFLYDISEPYGKVVNAAAYRLADAKYAEALRRYRAGGVRGRFRREIKALLDRYGPGWPKSGEVQRQLKSVAAGGGVKSGEKR